MANKKINQLDVRTSPSLTDLLAIADPSSGYAFKITGTSLQSLLDVTNRVPYTGASSNVNLGEFGLTAGQLTLDTTPTGTAVVGTTQWNDTIGSSQTLLKGGNVLLKNGVDLVARVVNKVSPATTLTKAAYQAVRVSGAQGQRLAIAYAQANNDNNSADTIGLVCENIAANQEGFIMTVGQLLDVNTTGSLQGETWADGDVLYLSPTTAGNLTNIKPNGSTGHIVVIGYVEYANANNGKIYVKISNGWELDELHNCYINAPANNEVLTYESSTSLWKNKSIATALGYTPANDSLVMHLAGTETATGVKTFSIGLATTTGDNFLNTSSGNLLVGYAATPASNLYKINVNGNARFNNLYVNDGTAYSLTFNAGTSNGQLLLAGSYPSVVLKTSTGDNRVVISNDGPNAKLQMWYGTVSSIYFDTNADGYYSLGLAIGKTSAPVTTAILELNSVSRGLLLPRMTTAQKNAISTPATSLLLYDTDLATFQYYSGSAWTSLGGGGGGISGSGTAGQVTYWSGTSSVTGTTTFVYQSGTGNLQLGTSTTSGYRLDVNGTGATAGALRVTGGNCLLAQTTLSSTSTQLTLDYPGQSLTTLAVGSTGNFTINPKASGTNLYFGTTGSTSGWAFGGTDIRGLLTIQKSVSTTYALNTDPADPGRVFVMQNNSTTNAANEFSNITMQINSTGSLSGGRILGDIRLIRKTLNQSDAFFTFSAFRQGATYKDYLKLDFDNSWLSGNLNIGTQSDPTAVLDLSASSTTRASLRIRSGTAPTTPNDGDIWYDGTNIYIRVGGSTKTFTLI